MKKVTNDLGDLLPAIGALPKNHCFDGGAFYR
jgi:hypothetical protein